MKLIRASGAVADALRRYDRDLEVRYSWEMRKWAITFRTRRPDLLPPPVQYTETAAGPLTSALSERSEQMISYHTRTFPACYVDNLNWPAYARIVESDTTRVSVARKLKTLADMKDAEYARKSKDRYKEARSYMNWHGRNNIMSD